ncbi:ATP-binding protein [Leekyejoonella antrihumi]|uniref:histidine kinase n=1 Tax=Leekyejoonella antrihumi TaxID=1660198 RepID=A0A563E1I8_9MICO|nr:ATP-binding protein [Leekyejoonella antrihumi]TWP36398.1 sensor histidine kinase KdpD [Leekyejoonella antrihumi]
MTRGSLRIYLGSAPGVGKTVKMLQEAHRRQDRGTDVVVGLVETHGRAYTEEALAGLEQVPRTPLPTGRATLWELDVEAVLRRGPQVVLVDELAHRNPAGSPHTRRWEDIDQLLNAGIDVISTLNVQHLESLNDAVYEITGVRQQETVPEAVARAADQLELVDMSPEALRRRLAHGNVYASERVDAALSSYFRPGNLSALRELALLWLADRVDEALSSYRAEHSIQATWPTRERVVVALTGGPEQETLLRRGARVAGRGGGQLIAVQVVPDTGLRDIDPAHARSARSLTTDLGGEFHTVTGTNVGSAILDFARSVNASQIVIGASSRTRWQRLWSGGVGETVVSGSGDINVLMVTHARAHAESLSGRSTSSIGARRQLYGWLLSTAGVALLTWLLLITSHWHDLPLEVLIYLALTVLTAIVGGLWPALATAVLSSLVLNWYFAPPFGTLTISQPQNAAALVLFVLVAVSVATVVHTSARRATDARVAQHDSRILADLAHSMMLAEDPLPALLQQARDIFAADGAALVHRSRGGTLGDTVLASGSDRDQDGSNVVRADVGEHHALVLVGGVQDASRRGLLEAFADNASEILHREDLAAQAAQAVGLARDNRARTALLAAVSHDLRTPLSAIKAGVSGLRSVDITLSADDQRDLLEQVEASTDQLDGLIENLLDMSRIQSRSITARTDTVLLREVLEITIGSLSTPQRVRTWLPDPQLVCTADAGLLERVLANLLENALRYSPGRQEIVMTAERLGPAVQIRVIDRGPGVPESERTGIFAPFQRYGDSPRGTGVGLGLAVAKGLTEAMDGSVTAADTPGGGLTMTVELPVGPNSGSGPLSPVGRRE